MTQTKLEIIGPYTPEHEGPYVWGDSALPCNVHAVVQGTAFITSKHAPGPLLIGIGAIYNAREVPVAREFWDVNWKVGRTIGFRFDNLDEAMDCWRKCADQMEIIHTREVLPGEGE